MVFTLALRCARGGVLVLGMRLCRRWVGMSEPKLEHVCVETVHPMCD